MFNQPGTRPEDNVEKGALTVATMEGESYVCMWGEGAEFEEEEIVELEVVKEATIQMTNLKSKYKPFIIFEPGVVIAPWVGEDHSFWNHWPVAQLPNDGRVAPAKDRPSHTSFSCGAPVVHEGEGDSHIAVMLYGLTESRIEALVPLARSWNHPAKLTLNNSGFKSEGYEKYERAYVVTCKGKSAPSVLEFILAATDDSPVVNPAFVIKNWGDADVTLEIDGKEVKRGKDFRFGHRHRLEGSDLIVWVKKDSTKPIKILLSPVE